ncbi:MAG: hypothetical protein ACI9QN_002496, partial [Arcticibacterium sp.]
QDIFRKNHINSYCLSFNSNTRVYDFLASGTSNGDSCNFFTTLLFNTNKPIPDIKAKTYRKRVI